MESNMKKGGRRNERLLDRSITCSGEVDGRRWKIDSGMAETEGNRTQVFNEVDGAKDLKNDLFSAKWLRFSGPRKCSEAKLEWTVPEEKAGKVDSSKKSSLGDFPEMFARD